MKKRHLLLAAFAAAFLPLVEYAYCASVDVEATTGDTTIVVKEPPAMRRETIPAAPEPEYVWVNGYWAWRGRWVWVPGHWEVPPSDYTAWEGGTWVRVDGGWRWKPGRWVRTTTTTTVRETR
jgi:hypothetical protein